MADHPDRTRGRLRERLGTIRVRTTGAAVLVVGAGLIAAAVALVVLLERSMLEDVRTTAFTHAEVVADDLPPGGDPTVARQGDADEEFVQVLDARGDVIAATANVAGEPALAQPDPGRTLELESVPFEDGPFLAVAISAANSVGSPTVVVGRSVEDVAETTGRLGGLLAFTVPLLVLLVGFVTWRVVGWALRPVDAIRAEVDTISTRELHRRVPDPPGEDEIARLATTMNHMLTRLDDEQTRQRRFVADASHELRSPVASIRQHAEVALAHPDRSDLGELAAVVLEEDIRLQRIVEDLLLLTRADEGSLELQREPVDLDDLLFEDAARLREASGLEIDVGGVSAGRIDGDRAKLERLVRNLTDNAARHARTSVALALQAQDGSVVMTVDDDGAGIPEADRGRVFDRFVRLEDARDRDSGGSGLGLAIVREVAAAHGATATAGTGPLGGARLEVRFPDSA